MANKTLSGAEVIIECLKREGVDTIFGYPGGSAIPMFDAILDSNIKVVLTRHEQGATHMADGYARQTGKVGVALVTSGPGATNTFTGIYTALMDSSPIVVLLRGQKLRDGINQTKEMSKICVTKNHNFPIPNMDFDFLPLGLDIRLILKTGILPVMHGGNFHHNGGLIGAGTGCVPMECVEKAFLAFAEKYKDEV